MLCTKDTFAPPGGKRLVYFIDDLSMPMKEVYGAQPPLEILRQWMVYGFWYELKKQSPKYVVNTQLVTAMGHPGGGRQVISTRTLHCFHCINLTFPGEQTIRRIFGTMINTHLSSFDEDIKPVGDIATTATLEIYLKLTNEMLPTPAKPHYTFNLRDISRVFQGMLQAQRDYYDARDAMVRLWAHECCRVFKDRLSNDADRDFFDEVLNDKLTHQFNVPLKHLCTDGVIQPFGSFMREMPEGKVAHRIA